MDTASSDDADVIRSIDEGDSPSVAVVRAVSEATGRSVTELEPLEHTVDTDALDSLFSPRANDEPRTGRFSFEYAGLDVTISYHDYVEVRVTNED